MKYPEKYEFAAEIAIKAIAHMKKLEIPWTPNNYRIWYEYVVGSDHDLNRAVDDALSSEQGFNRHQAQTIYDTFFEPTDLAFKTQEWSERIETAASKIIAAVSSVQADTETYGAALASFSGNITGARDIEEIRSLVVDILSNTKTMEAQIVSLSSEVDNASNEIVVLKANLETARREALTDSLTGVANRKQFDTVLQETLIVAREAGVAFSVLLLDLDNFKALNDEHGHQAGDQVLRMVGQTLVQSVKGQDTSARYGGEEFAIILPGTGRAGAVAVADSIRKAIAAKKLIKKGSKADIGSITVSIGAAQYRDGDDELSLIDRVDDALYRAKKAGKNRVEAEIDGNEPTDGMEATATG